MGDTFVDLTYRGLALGRRVKLAQVRPTTAYLEMPGPMPVGTLIGILTDDTVALDAQVVAIHEQVGGAGPEQPPGMHVQPRLEGDVARAWWKARVTLPDDAAPAPEPPPLPAQPAAIVLPKRRTLEGAAVPELVDDGLKTSVMQAVDPDEAPSSSEQPTDDGRRTTAMSAVDLAALGLDASAQTTTGQIPVVAGEDEDDGDAGGDKPEGKAKKKRRRR